MPEGEGHGAEIHARADTALLEEGSWPVHRPVGRGADVVIGGGPCTRGSVRPWVQRDDEEGGGDVGGSAEDEGDEGEDGGGVVVGAAEILS